MQGHSCMLGWGPAARAEILVRVMNYDGGALTCLVGSQQPLLFNRLAHQLVLCGVQLEHVACAALSRVIAAF